MKKDEKILSPIHVNAGIEAKYRKAMQAMIKDMARSYEYWLSATINKTGLAQDSDIADGSTPDATAIKQQFKKLFEQWTKNFADLSDKIAGDMVNSIGRHVDSVFMKNLQDAGMVFKFKMTQQVKEAAIYSLYENVGLIKTIPTQFHAQIEADVWRMISSGFKTNELREAIQNRYSKSHWRASFIARDQTSKVKAVIEKERQRELGITEAIWMHSGGGKEPRPTHVKAGRDKLRFNINTGAYLEANKKDKKEWILPGEAINCRCVSRSVIKIFE